MPDAPTYRDAARRCRLLGEHAAREAGTHRSSSLPERVASGPLRDTIDDLLLTVHAHLVRAAADLSRLAAECDRRAEVCDAYARELRHHRQLPLLERLVRPAPLPPASWVSP